MMLSSAMRNPWVVCLAAFMTACATAEPLPGDMPDGGYFPDEGSGGAGVTPSSSTGGESTSPGGGGNVPSGAGTGNGSAGAIGTGGASGTGGTSGTGGASGTGGTCPLFPFCPIATGGSGGASSGGTGGVGGMSTGGAGGAASCDNAVCFDVFDCVLWHPDMLNCGFTKCEAFTCKK